MNRTPDTAEKAVWESKDILIKNMSKLPPRDQSFATSLISQLEQKGLTNKQAEWLIKLAIKCLEPTPERKKTNIGDLAGINKLFDSAAQYVQKPKITLAVPTIEGDPASFSVVIKDKEVKYNKYKLWPAGANARVPGSINVLDVATSEWCGRILSSGDFEESPRIAKMPREIIPGLKRLADDPLTTATLSGSLSGNCCFCNKELTDGRSLAMGYGPICAAHFGLSWGDVELKFNRR